MCNTASCTTREATLAEWSLILLKPFSFMMMCTLTVFSSSHSPLYVDIFINNFSLLSNIVIASIFPFHIRHWLLHTVASHVSDVLSIRIYQVTCDGYGDLKRKGSASHTFSTTTTICVQVQSSAPSFLFPSFSSCFSFPKEASLQRHTGR